MRKLVALALAAGGLLALCVPGSSAAELAGEIKCDGSSTVYLITQAMAKEFCNQHGKVNVSVGISGTGGGFQKFIKGETDISNASRRIKDAESSQCKANGVDYLELQVGWDGLAVVIHPDNTWARKLTVEQLNKMWRPKNPAQKWSEIDPSWPDEKINLFGAGAKSGTFDYFTEAVNGKEKECRTDYTPSEDDNVTVRGVAQDQYALGFFGLAYFDANKDKLALVAVAAKGSKDYVLPTQETVLSGKYKPLSRPLYIYVKKQSLKRPEVQEFAKFYLRRSDLVAIAKYVSLNRTQLFEQQEKLDEALEGQR